MAKCTFVYDRKDNVSYLSRSIVYYEGEEPFVYAVKGEDTIEKKFIKTGIENDENVEVLSGVDDSTKIISTWSNDLAEGALVKINKDEPGKKISSKNNKREDNNAKTSTNTNTEIEKDNKDLTDKDIATGSETKIKNKKDISSKTNIDKNVREDSKNILDKNIATKSDVNKKKGKLEE